MSSSTRGSLTLLVLVVVAVLLMWWIGAGQPTGDSTSIPSGDPTDSVGESDTGADGVTGEEWRVDLVVDGDTVEVSHGRVEETVRFIGIDTPERDECGYEEARSALAGMVEGRTVTLVPGAPTDRDDYGRLLRYVEVDSLDAGLWMLEHGYAAEVYDSRRGKPHDREDEYMAADETAPDFCSFDAG